MKSFRIFLPGIVIAFAIFTVIGCSAPATAPSTSPATGSPTVQQQPIDSTQLKTIMSDMWIQASTESTCVLEGPAFDRNGDFYFVDMSGRGRVYKANVATKQFKIIYEDGKSNFVAAKIHKDGRIFLCGYVDNKFVILKADGTFLNEIKPTYNGKNLIPDDMAFDRTGNFYFTSYDKASETGGVYRMSVDLANIELVVGGLDNPNGVSLSPDGKRIWVSQTIKRTLTRCDLGADGKVVATTMYKVPGTEPGWADSNQVDSQGNVYQALYQGARFVVFNSDGVQIATVRIPQADEADFNQTTNVTFAPGTDIGYLTTSGKGGGRIYTFKGVANGQTLYSHQ
jgi:lactonase